MVVSPVLVGRASQIEMLQQVIRLSQASNGQFLLLSGEAGIGKSRLVAEAKSIVKQLGFRILAGACFEPDRALPYALFVDMLRDYFSSSQGQESALQQIGGRSELIKILPELEGSHSDETLEQTLTTEQGKRRLFQAITQWIVEFARRQPILVIVEDLHWSDETSLEALLYMARRLNRQPILLLVTYRPEEAASSLSHFLAEVDRAHLGIEIELRPLAKPEVDAMLRGIFKQNRPVQAEILDAIYLQTEGNPFYIEEIVKSLPGTENYLFSSELWGHKQLGELHIPRSVQDAVHRRVVQLSEPAQHLLRLAAVAGRRFDFELLKILLRKDEGDLLIWIKETILAQLVVEESTEQFAFRHALTRQAIYTELLARERKILHNRILAAMEEHFAGSMDSAEKVPGASLADLSYHAYEAEDWEKAFLYAERAGLRAQAIFAAREAVEQFTRALDAGRRLSRSVPVNLRRNRGQAYEQLGFFTGALADYEQALHDAHEINDGLAEWQCLIDLGSLWAVRDYERTGVYFQRATQLAQSLDNPHLHARSLNRLGNWLVNIGSTADGLQAHYQALQIFQSKQDIAGTAETLDLLGMANALGGDMLSAQKYSSQAIALFHQLGDRRGPVSDIAVLNADVGFSEPVTWAPRALMDCEHEAAEALQLAQELDWPAGQAQTEWTWAVAASAFGQLGQGLAHAQEALRIATAIEHQQWTAAAYAALGQVFTLLLQPDAALQNLEAGLPIAQKLGSAYWIGNITTYLAHAYLLRNEPQLAEGALRKVFPPDHLPRNLAERRMLWAWGEVLLALGQAKDALSIAQQLIETAPGGDQGQPIPALLKLKGQALMALEQYDSAEVAQTEAKRGAAMREARPLLLQIVSSLAGLYHHLKREGEMQQALWEAQSIIQSMAETIDDDRLRASFTSTASRWLPGSRPLSPRQAAKQHYEGLTSREREIAQRIMVGKSNCQIAEDFSLSERTVENHVANILAKLGFDSRTQIAAWAVRVGLSQDPLKK